MLRRGMLEQRDIQDAIDEAIETIGIPEQYREDASQEGWLAALECRDITAALRYWYDRECGFLQKHSI